MLSTIDTVCGELHNYFEDDRVIGDYTIEEGRITLPFLVNGQFFRIVGSKFNDGVYIYADNYIILDVTWEDFFVDNPDWQAISARAYASIQRRELADETFHGAIWLMRMPRNFLRMCQEIEEYNLSDAAKPSPFTSENISGFYSYTKGDADSTSWQSVFASKVKQYRKAANIWL